MNTKNEQPKKRGRKPLEAGVKRKTATFCIQPDIIQKVERIAEESDKSKSEVINNILAHYLRFNP